MFRSEHKFNIEQMSGNIGENPRTGVEIMSESSRAYLPAAGRDWCLPLYDPFVKLLGGDAAHRALIEQAGLQPGQRVLEVGCGTGTLTLRIKRRWPDVEVVGLDPDPKALERAGRKAGRAGVSIQFDRGFGDALPYPDGWFDRVLSSFMFHHLPAGAKGKFLRAVRGVLRPGGSFHMLDFEPNGGGVHGFFARVLHTSHRMQDNAANRVLGLMSEAGFAQPETVGRRTLLVGRVAYYRAST
jgi:ubiquinone/menaquinone biosynthesis C-methylase UbiE